MFFYCLCSSPVSSSSVKISRSPTSHAFDADSFHHSLARNSINRWSQAGLPERSYYSTNTHYKLRSAPAVTHQSSQHVCRIYDRRNRIFLQSASDLSYMIEFTRFCPKACLNGWLFCTPKAEMYCERSHGCACYYHLTRLQFVPEGFLVFL